MGGSVCIELDFVQVLVGTLPRLVVVVEASVLPAELLHIVIVDPSVHLTC